MVSVIILLDSIGTTCQGQGRDALGYRGTDSISRDWIWLNQVNGCRRGGPTDKGTWKFSRDYVSDVMKRRTLYLSPCERGRVEHVGIRRLVALMVITWSLWIVLVLSLCCSFLLRSQSIILPTGVRFTVSHFIPRFKLIAWWVNQSHCYKPSSDIQQDVFSGREFWFRYGWSPVVEGTSRWRLEVWRRNETFCKQWRATMQGHPSYHLGGKLWSNGLKHVVCCYRYVNGSWDKCSA